MKNIFLPICLFCAFIASAQNPLRIPSALYGNQFNLNLVMGFTPYFGQQTMTMGANGNIMGPTLFLDQGDSVTINVTNSLGHESTIHWHGLHVSPENDGGPHSIIADGATWNTRFKVMDWASTYWYHPHLHMHTDEQLTKGLAGFVIVKDSLETNLNLPRTYGVDDIPLLVQSRGFDSTNQFLVGSAADSFVLVNGTMNPYIDAPSQIVRFRLLNGSSERSYNFGFSDNRNFYVIGSDGGLLTAPVSLTRLKLSPGERAEILVDFGAHQGQTIYLMSYASEFLNGIYGAAQPGMGAGQQIPGYSTNPLNGRNFNILEIRVGAATANPVNSVPTSLVTHNPWTEGTENITRTLTFRSTVTGPTAINGPFTINNQAYDMDVVNYTIPLDNIEIWSLINSSPIAHPFHIHDVQFYILDINGVAPAAHEQGRKDVVMVMPMQTVRIITKFEDFTSDTMPYMYHCHLLTHEDDGMMGQFLVVDTSTNTAVNPINNKQINVNLFPNPFSEKATLVLEGDLVENFSLEIYNIQGKRLQTDININGNVAEINRSNLNAGIYFYQILSKGKILSQGKITIND
jgi:FtsP/CotA-like multicopper oxidase with cupredoxin domain